MRKREREESENGGMPTLCERSIWTFYEWAAIIAPIFLMVTHWGIFYVFSQNSHELMHYSDANEICIAWMYSIMFLFAPLMLMPANYFFKWCSLFRIPFFYFIFINVERWYYGSWFCTNEMVNTHYILIYCIVALYAFNLSELYLRHRNKVNGWIRNFVHDDGERTDEEIDLLLADLNREREKKNGH